jgi:hypothetical protein
MCSATVAQAEQLFKHWFHNYAYAVLATLLIQQYHEMQALTSGVSCAHAHASILSVLRCLFKRTLLKRAIKHMV